MNDEPMGVHVREYHSPLASGEKRVLIWLAKHTPESVNPDHLTLLGFSGILLSSMGFWLSSRELRALVLVVLGLALNWLGDSLDGTLARVRGKLRPRYGYYTDHVLDMIGTAVLLIGMALSGFMSPMVALTFLIAYLLVTGEVYLSTHVRKVFRMSFMGVGPTELRILLAVGTLFLFRKPMVTIAGAGPYRLFDVGGVASIAGLTLALLVSTVRNIRALYREEPLPR